MSNIKPFEDRKYQLDAIAAVGNYYQQGKRRILLVAPTGTGKTATACLFIARVLAKNNPAIFITHRLKLKSQTGKSFERARLNWQMFDASKKHRWSGGLAYCAMAQTLSLQDNLTKFTRTGLAIVDEAHRQDADKLFLKDAFLNDCFVLGLTATPFRNGKMRQLALNYDALYVAIDITEAIKQGFIVNCIMYHAGLASAAAIQGRDYSDSESFHAMNNARCYDGAIEAWRERADGLKTIAFASNIEHAILLCLKFANAGIKAKYVVSEPPRPAIPTDANDKSARAKYVEADRVMQLYNSTYMQYSGEQEAMFNGLADDKCTVLVNAGIAVEGVDVPDVSCVLISRLTNNVARFIQMLGRGARAAENKTHFIGIYMGTNAEELGAFSSAREFSLWHGVKKGRGAPPMRFCGRDSSGKIIQQEASGCGRMIPASARICPYPDCGHKKAPKNLKKKDVILFDGNGKKSLKEFNHRELAEYWRKNHLSSAWVWRELWLRGGYKELEAFARADGWSNATLSTALGWCKKTLTR